MAWPAGEAAFVTGSASGIGLGIARALVKAGARVALADIDGDRLDQVADELADGGAEVIAIPLDVSDPAQWEPAAERAEAALGPISVLCNNAGVSGGKLIKDTPFELYRWIQQINIDAQYLGIQTFLPRFARSGARSHILNTASTAGLLASMPTQGAYGASKWASVGLSFTLREELRGSPVNVSVLCPGTVATRLGITAAEAEARKFGEEVNAEVMQFTHTMLSAGADPDLVGEQVVDALRNGDFLIVTHREWLPYVRRMHDEVERAFTDFDGRYGPDPSLQVLEHTGDDTDEAGASAT